MSVICRLAQQLQIYSIAYSQSVKKSNNKVIKVQPNQKNGKVPTSRSAHTLVSSIRHKCKS